ncbi:uncharacterized protein LOC128298496 [Anopheles moucheti]|uniref:uncharacterized protein LOC128298496 n=1 Tax=Anopheles moucheti TaxID=186751 RepID=UPI0022F04BEA|nr:uncharacterized protein LOC128298496 [Anopheles moucheti]
MDSSQLQKDGNFYRKRKRELEELDRKCDEQLSNVNFSSVHFPWPDVQLESHTPDPSEILADVSSSLFSDDFVGGVENNAVEDTKDGDEDDGLNFVNNLSLTDALRHLVITCRLSRFVTKAILAILRKHFQAPVPKPPQTLLKTPPHVGQQIKPINGGQLWYRGIQPVLASYFE